MNIFTRKFLSPLLLATALLAALAGRLAASGVNTVAGGGLHSFTLRMDGTLWAQGSNTYGQLGDGTTTNRSTPVQIASGVAAVAAGGSHSLFLRKNGTLWAMGFNSSGQLGDGSTTDQSSPEQIASGVSAIAAGSNHSLFLKTDGTLWAMGYNGSGQLGDGTTTNRSTPVQIASGVSAVTAGGAQSFFQKADGTRWAMGSNSNGQLGDGTTTNRPVPIPVPAGVSALDTGSQHSLLLHADGTLWTTGANASGQLGDGTGTDHSTPVQVASGVTAVAAGLQHSLFLKADRTLWAMGANAVGQLGDGTTTSRVSPVQVAANVSAVFAGDVDSFFRKMDGSLWGMGNNFSGELGDGTTTERNSPVQLVAPSADDKWDPQFGPQGVSSGFSAVYAVATNGTDVYVGGQFTSVGGVPAMNIAKWNGTGWSALGAGVGTTITSVSAITVLGNNVYVGGNFTTAGGNAVNYVARWDGSTWSALGTGVDATVFALANDGVNVYAGGSFGNAGGGNANAVARWDGSSWHSMNGPLGNGAGGAVFAIAVLGPDVYIGGNFFSAGLTLGVNNGIPARGIARWNGAQWFTVGPIDPADNSYGVNGTGYRVQALATSGTDLYVGGAFTKVGGSPANGIAKWTGSAWQALGSGASGYYDEVDAIAASGGNVYATGSFSSINGVPAANVAQWNGSTWSALGSGLGDNYTYGQAAATTANELYVGGTFSTAGGVPANYFARYAFAGLAPVITSPPTAGGLFGQPFAYTISATSNPTSFSATGLPAGLAVDPASGIISGTAVATGTTPVTVSATNAGGTGTASLSIAITLTPPPAPVASAATGATTSGFTANWAAASGATGYQLDVSTGNTFASFVSGYQNLDVGNVTSLGVTGLAIGTTYYYRVRAYNGGSTGGNSNTITAATTAPTPPAPAAAAATAIINSGFTANWAGSAGATNYRLDVSGNNTFTSLVSGYSNLSVGNFTSQVVTGLAAGTTYYYRVRASNSSGTSGNSGTITVVTAPAVPLNDAFANATLITGSSATVTGSSLGATKEAGEPTPTGDIGGHSVWWQWVAPGNGTVALTTAGSNFDTLLGVYTGGSVGALTEIAVNDDDPNNNVVTSALTFTAVGGTTYWIEVDGYGGDAGAITLQLTYPASGQTLVPPVAGAASGIAPTSFIANWGGATGAQGYRLDVATISGYVPGYQNLDVGNVTSLSVTGLTPATQYGYVVRAYNATATTANSNVIVVTTAALPSFLTWQQARFTAGELANPAVSGPNAVYGLDGLSNLVKYGLGLEPKTDITSGLPYVGITGTDWVYTYNRPANRTDLTYSVEVSTDLANWSTAGVTHEFVSTSGGIDTWHARYPLGSANNVYFRLKVINN